MRAAAGNKVVAPRTSRTARPIHTRPTPAIRISSSAIGARLDDEVNRDWIAKYARVEYSRSTATGGIGANAAPIAVATSAARQRMSVLQLATEERHRLRPRVGHGVRVIHLRPVLVEERMLRVRVRVELVRLPEFGQPPIQLVDDCRRHERVLPGV